MFSLLTINPWRNRPCCGAFGGMSAEKVVEMGVGVHFIIGQVEVCTPKSRLVVTTDILTNRAGSTAHLNGRR